MMSVEWLGRVVCGLCLVAAAAAVADKPPDAELLEYLGLWEETDEEWLLQDEILDAEDDGRTDSPKDNEESPENNDES